MRRAIGAVLLLAAAAGGLPADAGEAMDRRVDLSVQARVEGDALHVRGRATVPEAR